MSFNTSLISEEQWWSPFPPTLSCWEVSVSEKWKIRPYNTCCMCCPSWARHTARRFCQSAWTRNNTSGWMASQHFRIRCCRWWKSRIGSWYTRSFRWPQRKKSKGVRSGDRGGHSIGPRRPIQRPGNCVSNHWRSCSSEIKLVLNDISHAPLPI